MFFKIICLQKKDSNLPLSYLLLYRPLCYHSTSKTHVGDRIFIKFTEFSERPLHLGKTPIDVLTNSSLYKSCQFRFGFAIGKELEK